MHVEPGDRRIVAVRPYAPAGLSPQDCERCGTHLAPVDAHEVLLRENDIDLSLIQVVCQTCADVLRPVRVLVDVTRATEADRRHEPLRGLLEEIRAARRRPLDDRILLRASDTDVLARSYGLDRSSLVELLKDDGLVALAA